MGVSSAVLRCSFTAVLLQVFKNCPRLFRWEIRARAHVEQDRLPLRFRSFRGVTFGVATIAVQGVQLGAAELLLLFFRLFCGRVGPFGLGFLPSYQGGGEEAH